MIQKHRIDVTTSSGGAATGYSLPVCGRIEHLRYTPDPNTPLDSGAGITVTGEQSGVAIVAKTNIGSSAFTLAPRQPLHAAADGSALTYDGTHGVAGPIALAGERIKLVVASGGNALAGSFEFVVDDD